MKSSPGAASCSSGIGVERAPACGYLFHRVGDSPSRLPPGRTARVITETSMPTERTARLQQYGETLAELRRYL